LRELCERAMAVLKVRFRLCKARSRISRCGLSIALSVINKLPLEREATELPSEVS
jgi:hypothetical protein